MTQPAVPKSRCDRDWDRDQVLVGRQVMLRPVAEADLATLTAWDDDPDTTLWMGKKFSQVSESIADWYRRAQEDPTLRALAILHRDGRLIGEIELDHIDRRTGSAELRVMIGEGSLRGKGLGSDALQLVLAAAFGPWNLRQVYLRVYAANRRAVRCYRNLGFAVEGVLAPIRRRRDPAPILLMSLDRERFQAAAAGLTGNAAPHASASAE